MATFEEMFKGFMEFSATGNNSEFKKSKEDKDMTNANNSNNNANNNANNNTNTNTNNTKEGKNMNTTNMNNGNFYYENSNLFNLYNTVDSRPYGVRGRLHGAFSRLRTKIRVTAGNKWRLWRINRIQKKMLRLGYKVGKLERELTRPEASCGTRNSAFKMGVAIADIIRVQDETRKLCMKAIDRITPMLADPMNYQGRLKAITDKLGQGKGQNANRANANNGNANNGNGNNGNGSTGNANNSNGNANNGNANANGGNTDTSNNAGKGARMNLKGLIYNIPGWGDLTEEQKKTWTDAKAKAQEDKEIQEWMANMPTAAKELFIARDRLTGSKAQTA